MRRRMRESGIVVASLVVDTNGSTMSQPFLSLPGLLDPAEDAQLISIIKNDLTESLQSQKNTIKGNISHEQLENVVRSSIRRTLKNEINKNPIIIVNIEKINLKL